MLRAQCRCGTIHYTVFNAASQPISRHSSLKLNELGMVDDPHRELKKAALNTASLKEQNYCQRCGTLIYEIDAKDNTWFIIEHQNVLKRDFQGALLYGL